MQYIQNYLIIFTSCYIGVGHHLFQIHASDFSEFVPPFFNDFLNAVAAPLMILLIPAFVLYVIHLILNRLNKKLSGYFLSIILSVALVLYIMRAYYLIEGGYILSLTVLLTLLVFVFILVLILRRFFFNMFFYFSIISIPLTINFSYSYYSYLTSGSDNQNSNIEYDISNIDTPIFVFVFDEVSLYLLLDQRGEINLELFPQLSEFVNASTWYPNAITNISATDFVLPEIVSGQDLFISCANKGESVGEVNNKLFKGECGKRDILKLHSIKDFVANTNFNKLRLHALKSEIQLKVRILNYFNDIFIAYTEGTMNPFWGQIIVGKLYNLFVENEFHVFQDLANKHILQQVYGINNMSNISIKNASFVNCLKYIKTDEEQFHILNESIVKKSALIYPILIGSTHSPFCHGTESPVNVLYPERYVYNDSSTLINIPDTYPIYLTEESECGYDEISYNIKRSRINQTIYLFKLFEQTLIKIKEAGLFDKSYIFVLSDHGKSFLGPSSGRKNKMSNTKLHKIDNRMMNSSIMFFVKYPYQKKARINDKVVYPYDIGATIVDILGIKPPWDIHGQSLIKESWKERKPPFNFIEYMITSLNNGLPEYSVRLEKINYSLEYFQDLKKRISKIDILYSNWLGKDISNLNLAKAKVGEIEYLKIEEALPSEDKSIQLVLGGHSNLINNKEVYRTYISINDKVIKVLRPCLRFLGRDHKLGNIPAGWVVTVPLDEYEGYVEIRAFSTVDEKEDKFYELNNSFKINISEISDKTNSLNKL